MADPSAGQELAVREAPAGYQVMLDSLRVRPGYKQTAVGVIPQDWDVKPLGEIADIDSDNLGSDSPSNYTFNYISLEDVDVGLLHNYSEQVFSSAPSRARRRLKAGDILVSTVRPNLQSHLLFSSTQSNWICSTGFSVVRCKSQDAVSGYVFFHLFGHHITKQIEALLTGSNYPAINGGDVKALVIPIPSLPEQRAIATALSDVDALIASLDKLVAKKRDLKQAAMQQLLTGQRRLPGFSEEWEQKWLGDLFTFGGGLSASRDQLSDSGYCYLHYGDIHKSSKIFIDVAAEFMDIPKLDVRLSDVSSSALLKDGDVVFVDASEDDEGTSRHWVIVNRKDCPYISGLHTIVAKSKDNSLNNGFKRYCFQTQYVKQQFRFFAVGTKVSGISKTNIAKIELKFPPLLEEQTAIAAVLSDMDAEIAALEARRDKTRALKQGMMQELLTGRIRLV